MYTHRNREFDTITVLDSTTVGGLVYSLMPSDAPMPSVHGESIVLLANSATGATASMFYTINMEKVFSDLARLYPEVNHFFVGDGIIREEDEPESVDGMLYISLGNTRVRFPAIKSFRRSGEYFVSAESVPVGVEHVYDDEWGWESVKSTYINANTRELTDFFTEEISNRLTQFGQD